jgi:transcription initiation factor TFIIB
MAERISLPRTGADQAKQLYKKIFDEEEAKGKSNAGLVAACLFVACRQLNVFYY